MFDLAHEMNRLRNEATDRLLEVADWRDRALRAEQALAEERAGAAIMRQRVESLRQAVDCVNEGIRDGLGTDARITQDAAREDDALSSDSGAALLAAVRELLEAAAKVRVALGEV